MPHCGQYLTLPMGHHFLESISHSKPTFGVASGISGLMNFSGESYITLEAIVRLAINATVNWTWLATCLLFFACLSVREQCGSKIVHGIGSKSCVGVIGLSLDFQSLVTAAKKRGNPMDELRSEIRNSLTFLVLGEDVLDAVTETLKCIHDGRTTDMKKVFRCCCCTLMDIIPSCFRVSAECFLLAHVSSEDSEWSRNGPCSHFPQGTVMDSLNNSQCD